MPHKQGSTTGLKLGVVLATVLTLVIVTWALVKPPASPPGERVNVTSVDESDIADFVGNEACRSCHPGEFEQHRTSHHALALHTMEKGDLGDLAPPIGRINNSQYAIVEENGQYYFEVNPPSQPDKYQLWPLDYAFGSGKSGISYVSMLEGRNAVEMKMSYFPKEKLWRVTPGQKLDNPAAAGNIGNLEQSRRCIGCHVTALSKNTFVPRRELFGVGCESCHGAGKPHIQAVQARASDLKMAKLHTMGARDLNTLCGTCHQTEKDVIASPAMAKMTYRFQPYGLMKSPCFVKSKDTLSCSTCHNPHTDTSHDTAAYVRACLNCHTAPAPTNKARVHTKVCPVNATADCVRCHMPARDALSAMGEHSGIPLTEHRIGIYRDIPR